MESEVDSDYMDEIICPHCGHDNGTEHEGGSEWVEECGECDKEYSVTADYSVSFSTTVYDREAEERKEQKMRAEGLASLEESKAECAKFPPGSRVRVRSGRRRGEAGIIANRELSSMVYVHLDGVPYGPSSFLPREIEAE